MLKFDALRSARAQHAALILSAQGLQGGVDMRAATRAVSTAILCLLAGLAAAQTPAALGTEEFGMTPKQLVEAVDKVEANISKCMREQGFEYVAADFNTVRRGM